MKNSSLIRALSAAGLVALAASCATTEASAPTDTGFLSTYRNLEQVSDTTWRFREPSQRISRYKKFIVHPVEVAIPADAQGKKTPTEDIQRLQTYMGRAAVRKLTEAGMQVVNDPAGDVAEIRMALTDAFDNNLVIGIAIEAEMIDSVSSVQLGALVDSKRGKNLTLSNAWRDHDAKEIVDGWAERLRDFVTSED